MKKRLSISLLAVMLCLTLVGCGQKKEDTIVGKWTNGTLEYTFNEDETCVYSANKSNMNCTYKIDGNKLTIHYVGDTDSFNTTYSIEKDKLIIKDYSGRDVEYTREK